MFPTPTEEDYAFLAQFEAEQAYLNSFSPDDDPDEPEEEDDGEDGQG